MSVLQLEHGEAAQRHLLLELVHLLLVFLVARVERHSQVFNLHELEDAAHEAGELVGARLQLVKLDSFLDFLHFAYFVLTR